MPSETNIIIPLARAGLCLDCERIGESVIRCPGCGSTVMLSLAAVLNRAPQPTTAQEANVA